MASPFPGMDPFLEGEMWQEFHETLASSIRAQLMQTLPPKYVALLAKRYVMGRPTLGVLDVPSTRTMYPDVHVVDSSTQVREAVVAYGGGTVVEIPNLILEEIPLLSVEIRDVAERRLVTVIEILSPVNKRGAGARDYNEKRQALLATQVHLLELDLLRLGERIALQYDPPLAHYYIYLSRVERRPISEVWPVLMQSPLPTVPVPLLPGDGEVALALQTAVSDCFNLVKYERLLDYKATLPALSEADATWITEITSSVR